MRLTKGQEAVARDLGALRADLIVTPEASEDARRIADRIGVAHESVQRLLTEERFRAVLKASFGYRNEILAGLGWHYVEHRNRWERKEA